MSNEEKRAKLEKLRESYDKYWCMSNDWRYRDEHKRRADRIKQLERELADE
ncbi:MAG: hypothetical protein ACE5IR_08335 [bacterium]